jgi:glycosyltransferase involved in cell wall biosynthesis
MESRFAKIRHEAGSRGRMKVLHVITDLGQGGAEAVSFRLIAATTGAADHAVISLHQDGVFGPQLRARNIPVAALGMDRGRISVSALRRLRTLIVETRPDVIQTRLYHADLLVGALARFAGSPPVVWAVHSTELAAFSKTWKTRAVRRVCSWASGVLPSFIVSDARSTARFHVDLGYEAEKIVVIRNGVDPALFNPDAAARARIRSEWGIGADEPLLGCAARWDPLKDHANLLSAIAALVRKGTRFRCALVGSGMTQGNQDLQKLIDGAGVRDRLILAGPRTDMPAVMNALDLHVLPSCSESLPVAVIEAMACGIPCVVTDVGDAGDIVADTGWVVPARDSGALAKGIELALTERVCSDGRRASACRARITDEFSLSRMANEYASLWSRAVAARRAG